MDQDNAIIPHAGSSLVPKKDQLPPVETFAGSARDAYGLPKPTGRAETIIHLLLHTERKSGPQGLDAFCCRLFMARELACAHQGLPINAGNPNLKNVKWEYFIEAHEGQVKLSNPYDDAAPKALTTGGAQ